MGEWGLLSTEIARMAKTMQDYLRICLSQYRDVAIARYHRDFDWQSIEQRVSKDLGL